MYQDEVANPTSETETFFSLELIHGTTEVLLASGKGFATKETHVRIDGTDYHDTNDRAYQEVLLAASRGDREKFLNHTEVLESWRLLDKARLVWGTLHSYKCGVEIESLIKE
jgi:glucose-6-phosphate 1-dehydrogenase